MRKNSAEQDSCYKPTLCMEQITKRAEPAMLENINFKRPKKEQIVPAEIDNKVHSETHFSLSASSFSKSAVLQTKLQELKDVVPNTAIFSRFPIQKVIYDFSIDSRDETLTADECDNNLLPEPYQFI